MIIKSVFSVKPETLKIPLLGFGERIKSSAIVSESDKQLTITASKELTPTHPFESEYT